MAMASSMNLKARSLPTASLNYSSGIAQARIASGNESLGGFSSRKVGVLQRLSNPGVFQARSVAGKKSCGHALQCHGRGGAMAGRSREC